jgi:hypothetical protein
MDKLLALPLLSNKRDLSNLLGLSILSLTSDDEMGDML